MNSGGSWWLTGEHWHALEAAGWRVEWGGFLGALTDASLECETPRAAIESWEAATGMRATDEGCNCCGPPHEFSWDEGYVSGHGIFDVLELSAAEELRRRRLEEES